MFFSVAVLIFSAALLLFYLQAACERMLRREFEQQYFLSIASAYHLEFASLRPAPSPPASLSTILRVDFLKLSTLMKDARFKDRRFNRENLLKLYFRALLVLLEAGQILGVGEDQAVNKLTCILRYFANLIGERQNALPCSPLTPSEYLARV